MASKQPETQLSIQDQRLLENAEGYLELGLPKEALVALSKTSPAARQTFAWNIQQAEAYRALGDNATAIPFFYVAMRMVPDCIEVYVSLAWCLKRVNQLQAAIGLLLSARKIGAAKKDTPAAMRALLSYNLSCYYSLEKDKANCIKFLSDSFKHDKSFADLVAKESDFDNLRNDPDFQKLVRNFGASEDMFC